MTAYEGQKREKSWLEKLDEFLIDEFHHGLYRIVGETLWADVTVGAWHDPLNFFRCLNTECEYVIANQTKPSQIEIRLRDTNFSGQATAMGETKRFLESQLPCNRQKILLLH